SRNSACVIHCRRRTNSSSIIARCAAGPPNAIVPSFRNTRAISPRDASRISPDSVIALRTLQQFKRTRDCYTPAIEKCGSGAPPANSPPERRVPECRASLQGVGSLQRIGSMVQRSMVHRASGGSSGVNMLTLFGLFAVTAMLVTYALESRSYWFILAFAVACALGSAYGFLQGAWPFGVVEAIWSLVAVRRWYRARQ